MQKIDLMVTGHHPKVMNQTSDVALSPFRAAKDGTGAVASTLLDTAGDHNASQSEQRGTASAKNDAHDALAEHEPQAVKLPLEQAILVLQPREKSHATGASQHSIQRSILLNNNKEAQIQQ